jgi:hypothetical protein
MSFDVDKDILLVADVSVGIFELNIKTGKKKQLISASDVIGSSVSSSFV